VVLGFGSAANIEERFCVHVAGQMVLVNDETTGLAPEAKVLNIDGKFVCNVCQRSYNMYNTCVRHLDVHQGATTCPVCFRCLSHKFHLKRHMTLVHKWI
jgi:hypothetical protein